MVRKQPHCNIIIGQRIHHSSANRLRRSAHRSLSTMRRGTKRPRFSVGGHPVYENDDSSNQSGLGVIDYDDNSLSQPPDTSTNSSDQNHFPQNQFVPDRSRRVQRASIKPSHEDNTNLTACIEHLINVLSGKDKEGFFQYPVTDQVRSSNLIFFYFLKLFSNVLARTRLFSGHH